MINSASIIRIFDDYEVPVFCCDINLNVINVNAFILKHKMNIVVKQHINDIFPQNAVNILQALEKFSVGAPYFSTNFDYNLLSATIYMLPLRLNDAAPHVAQKIVHGITKGAGKDDTIRNAKFRVRKLNLVSFINRKNFSGITDCVKPFVILCYLDFADKDEALKLSAYSAAALISDRYRSPIAGIMNVSAILARRFQEMEDYKCLDYLNHIARCCYSMLRTSVSVQDYHMLVNDRREYKWKRVILNKNMEDLCLTIQALFIKSAYRFEYHLTDTEIITEIDEDMLSLAIFHVISNSCCFSPKGASIKLSLTRQNDSYQISISDEGEGIDNKIIHRIFDPFFTVHLDPVPEENIGMGLGLPIAKKIVEAHNGQIFVTSERNQGTTVVFRFPISTNTTTNLTLQSNTAKYMTDKFSNFYIIFADICDIKLY